MSSHHVSEGYDHIDQSLTASPASVVCLRASKAAHRPHNLWNRSSAAQQSPMNSSHTTFHLSNMLIRARSGPAQRAVCLSEPMWNSTADDGSMLLPHTVLAGLVQSQHVSHKTVGPTCDSFTTPTRARMVAVTGSGVSPTQACSSMESQAPLVSGNPVSVDVSDVEACLW